MKRQLLDYLMPVLISGLSYWLGIFVADHRAHDLEYWLVSIGVTLSIWWGLHIVQLKNWLEDMAIRLGKLGEFDS